MSEVFLIGLKWYNWSQIFIRFLFYYKSSSELFVRIVFFMLVFIILHVQVVATIYEDRMLSQSMMIWNIKHFWWVNIYTKHVIVQLFFIVYFLNFSFQISVLEPQNLYSKKCEIQVTKTRSCVCYAKRCVWDLVLS